MPLYSEKQTFQIHEDEKSDRVHLSQNQLIMIGVIIAALIAGVGLLCYYVPDRSCGRDSVIPDTTPGGKVTEPHQGGSTTKEVTDPDMPSTTIPMKESTTLSTQSPSEPWPGRLPANVIPDSYDLYLKPYINDDDVAGTTKRRFTFDGLVTIRVRCFSSTSRITLHSNNITFNSIMVTMMGDDTDIYATHSEEKEYDFLHIDVSQELVVDGVYDIIIDYLGELNSGLSGFYRTSYLGPDGTQVWAATSQMQATSARKALPCFDEPALRAVFNTTIEYRSHMAAITNGIEIKEEDLADDWKKTTYLPTPKMSTYLLAFTVGEFAYTETYTTNGVRFRAWSRPDAVNNTVYALETGSKIITYFEDYFNIIFPLAKQDMIAVPDFSAGAMENWGLIIYRETAMLYDPEVNSASNKQRVAVVVSHELAHQWFGNLVTPKWWDDLWLNEGFASYVEYLGVDHTEPDWGMMEQFVISDLQPVFELDSLGTSHPVRVAVGAPAEINEIFDSISYNKGASIIRMLNKILTEEVFTRGLTNYLKEHAYGNADSNDLWRALTEADKGYGDHDVKAIMDTWTLQMGYPLVTLERTGQTITAHQKHYLSNPSEGVSDKYGDLGYIWQVYIQYTDQSHNNFETPNSVWMNNEVSIDFPLSDSVGDDDWYLVNTYQYGYYRVNYDQENWRRLTNQLMMDHKVFPNENRGQMIDDAFSLAQSGNLSMVTALNLTRYLGNERDLLPWEATLDHMAYITDMFRLSGGYGPLELYMKDLVQPLYDALGWDDSDNVLEQYNRNNAIRVACFYRIRDCLDRASQFYREYMQNPEVNPISNNLKTTVYCNGIREGGQDEWDFGWNKYLSSTDSSEKAKWLSALGCSRQPWILNRYLLYTIEENSQVRSQDIASVLAAVGSSHIGVDLVWDFMRNEYDRIFDLLSDSIFTFSAIISRVPSDFNTQQHLDEWIAFGEGRDFGPAARTYEQGTETIKINMQWMEKYEDLITEWLEKAINE